MELLRVNMGMYESQHGYVFRNAAMYTTTKQEALAPCEEHFERSLFPSPRM